MKKLLLSAALCALLTSSAPAVAEDYTSDIAVYTQAGSTSGTASVLNGVTVAAS